MKPVCKKCGGTIHFEDGCRLCLLFETGNVPDGHRSACWPMPGSYSAALHPTQVAEVKELAKKLGVPTDFDKNCGPIFTSPKHKRDYGHIVEKHMTGNRLVDRSGGYSDT